MPSFEIQADIFTRLSVFDSPKGSSNTFKTHKNISLYFKRRYLIIYKSSHLCINVLDKLDCDILAGIRFCKINDIIIHLKDEYITIKDLKFPYGAKNVGRQHDIKRTESFIVRLLYNTANVVMPGEFVEIYADELKSFEGWVAVEPHESPLSGN